MLLKYVLSSLAAAQLVTVHGGVINAVGDMESNGGALSIKPSTPRNVENRNQFQNDSPRPKNNIVDAFGETFEGASNEPAQQMAKVVQDSNRMPKISARGMEKLNVREENHTGAGPYKGGGNKGGKKGGGGGGKKIGNKGGK